MLPDIVGYDMQIINDENFACNPKKTGTNIKQIEKGEPTCFGLQIHKNGIENLKLFISEGGEKDVKEIHDGTLNLLIGDKVKIEFQSSHLHREIQTFEGIFYIAPNKGYRIPGTTNPYNYPPGGSCILGIGKNYINKIKYFKEKRGKNEENIGSIETMLNEERNVEITRYKYQNKGDDIDAMIDDLQKVENWKYGEETPSLKKEEIIAVLEKVKKIRENQKHRSFSSQFSETGGIEEKEEEKEQNTKKPLVDFPGPDRREAEDGDGVQGQSGESAGDAEAPVPEPAAEEEEDIINATEGDSKAEDGAVVMAFDSHFENLNKEINSLNKKLDELYEKSDSINKEIQLNEDLDNEDLDNEEKEKLLIKIDELKEQIEDIKEQIEDTKSEIQKKEDEIEYIKTQFDIEGGRKSTRKTSKKNKQSKRKTNKKSKKTNKQSKRKTGKKIKKNNRSNKRK